MLKRFSLLAKELDNLPIWPDGARWKFNAITKVLTIDPEGEINFYTKYYVKSIQHLLRNVSQTAKFVVAPIHWYILQHKSNLGHARRTVPHSMIFSGTINICIKLHDLIVVDIFLGQSGVIVLKGALAVLICFMGAWRWVDPYWAKLPLHLSISFILGESGNIP